MYSCWVQRVKKTALQEVQSTFSMEPNSPKSFEGLMDKTTQPHSLVALQGAEIYLIFIPSNHSQELLKMMAIDHQLQKAEDVQEIMGVSGSSNTNDLILIIYQYIVTKTQNKSEVDCICFLLYHFITNSREKKMDLQSVVRSRLTHFKPNTSSLGLSCPHLRSLLGLIPPILSIS